MGRSKQWDEGLVVCLQLGIFTQDIILLLTCPDQGQSLFLDLRIPAFCLSHRLGCVGNRLPGFGFGFGFGVLFSLGRPLANMATFQGTQKSYYRHVKQGQDNTKHAHSETKTDKTNGHNTYTQRNNKEQVSIFTHKQTCTCTYSLVDVV